jgi:hypothetical protein
VYKSGVKDWESEEQIKAQLRDLTERTRRLRQELDALVRPAASSPTRGFIQRQSWPKAQPPEVAGERRRRPRKSR